MLESWEVKGFFPFSVVLLNAKLHVTKLVPLDIKTYLECILHTTLISDNLKVVAITYMYARLVYLYEIMIM